MFEALKKGAQMSLKIDLELCVESGSRDIETPDIEAAVIKKLQSSCVDLIPVIKAYENLAKMPLVEQIGLGVDHVRDELIERVETTLNERAREILHQVYDVGDMSENHNFEYPLCINKLTWKLE